jgi:cobaltochelatase CobS
MIFTMTTLNTIFKNVEFTFLALNEEAERSEKVAVIVTNSDLKAGKSKFYAFRENAIYNPNDEFKPIYGNAVHRLKGAILDNYNDLIPAAKAKFEQLRKELSTLSAQNGGSANSAEIEILETQLSSLRNVINQKTVRINELSDKVSELSAAAQNNNSSQTSTMAQLIAAQAELVEKMKPKTISVQINENTRELTGSVVHERFEAVLKLLFKKQDVYMAGPAGTGKSHIAEKAAEALGLKFYFETSLTQKFELTGYKDGSGVYHETQFYRAFVDGGVFMLDEIDASTPEVLVVINTALAQRYFPFPNGAVKAHPDFRVVAAGNTLGKGADIEYTGRFQLDASTMDRFKTVIIQYSPAIEEHIAAGDTELIEFTRSLRKSVEYNQLKLIVSYRFMNGVKDLEDVFELPEILDMSLLKGMASDDINMLVRNMSVTPSNKYYKALKELA